MQIAGLVFLALSKLFFLSFFSFAFSLDFFSLFFLFLFLISSLSLFFPYAAAFFAADIGPSEHDVDVAERGSQQLRLPHVPEQHGRSQLQRPDAIPCLPGLK